MSNYSPHFASFYNLNHLFFDSFRFISGYSLYIFDLAMNQITKTTIRPSLPHNIKTENKADWIDLNFNKTSTSRQRAFQIIKNNNYKVGNKLPFN